jgi:hypothetical protein
LNDSLSEAAASTVSFPAAPVAALLLVAPAEPFG